jgi:hypothetical protein
LDAIIIICNCHATKNALAAASVVVSPSGVAGGFHVPFRQIAKSSGVVIAHCFDLAAGDVACY